MRFHALAADFDGTLAHDGAINDSTTQALHRLKGSGRQLWMVTGRELEELLDICPQVELFGRVVAENGALIYHPATKEVTILADPPSEQFVHELHRRGVKPLSVGHVILATVDPYHNDFHLRNHEYSAWFEEQIKDPELADEVRRIESNEALSTQESRSAIRAAIESRYTLPADKPSGVMS